MNISPVREHDVVECDIRGDRFFAKAGPFASKGQLIVHPINGGGRGHTRYVTARQVVGHYRRSKASR